MSRVQERRASLTEIKAAADRLTRHRLNDVDKDGNRIWEPSYPDGYRNDPEVRALRAIEGPQEATDPLAKAREAKAAKAAEKAAKAEAGAQGDESNTEDQTLEEGDK